MKENVGPRIAPVAADHIGGNRKLAIAALQVQAVPMQHLGRLPVRKSLGRRIRHPLLARDLPPRRVPLSRRALVSRSSPTTTIGVIQIGRGKAGRKCPLKHILKFYFFSLVWGINGEDFFWQDFCMITKAGIHGVFIFFNDPISGLQHTPSNSMDWHPFISMYPHRR